jgi:hypothetical protein
LTSEELAVIAGTAIHSGYEPGKKCMSFGMLAGNDSLSPSGVIKWPPKEAERLATFEQLDPVRVIVVHHPVYIDKIHRSILTYFLLFNAW